MYQMVVCSKLVTFVPLFYFLLQKTYINSHYLNYLHHAISHVKLLIMLLGYITFQSMIFFFSCPIGCADSKGNYFMGDTSNPCVYYWCEDGVFLPWVFPCSYGASVPYGYFGQIVPCIDNLRTCYGGGEWLTYS